MVIPGDYQSGDYGRSNGYNEESIGNGSAPCDTRSGDNEGPRDLVHYLEIWLVAALRLVFERSTPTLT
jgi:hypothetical protein